MPIKNLLKASLAGAALLALSFTGASAAPSIPCGTAKLIVPWGAGGGTDVIFRQMVDKVNKNGAKPQLQVVNVGGQGGNKGAKQASKAKPDGCTLFAIHQSAITSYFTGRIDITWDAFETISMVTSTPSIIGANVNTPYNNISELVAAAKKAPGTITAGGTFEKIDNVRGISNISSGKMGIAIANQAKKMGANVKVIYTKKNCLVKLIDCIFYLFLSSLVSVLKIVVPFTNLKTYFY